jgi:hypothetical protein
MVQLPPRRSVVWMNRVTGWKGLNAYLGAACVEDISSPAPPGVQERATRLLHWLFNGRLHNVSATHIPTQNAHKRPSLQPLHLHIKSAHKHEFTSFAYHLSNHNYCCSLPLRLVWSPNRNSDMGVIRCHNFSIVLKRQMWIINCCIFTCHLYYIFIVTTNFYFFMSNIS